MNLAESIPIRSAGGAFRALVRRPWLSLAIIGLDVLFILFFGLTAPLRDQAFGAAALAMVENLGQSARLGAPAVSLLAGPHAGVFWPSLFLLVLVIYAGWLALQGTAWWLAGRIVGRRHAFLQSLARFAVASLPWFLAAAVLATLRFILGFRSRLLARAMGEAFPVPFWPDLLLLAVGYLGLFAVAAPGLRSGLRAAGKPAGFAAGGLLLVALLVTDFLLVQAGRLGPAAMLAAGFLLLFPLLAWGKAYLVMIVEGLPHAVRARH
jgi:hypothetical protein